MDSNTLWLPPSARRRPKLLRPDSRDYQTTSVMDALTSLTYDAFIAGMRDEWESQFTEAERAGPVSFVQYMTESFETLKWRLDTDIPDALRRGAITRVEYNGSMAVFTKLKDYSVRFLKEHTR